MMVANKNAMRWMSTAKRANHEELMEKTCVSCVFNV